MLQAAESYLRISVAFHVHGGHRQVPEGDGHVHRDSGPQGGFRTSFAKSFSYVVFGVGARRTGLPGSRMLSVEEPPKP